MADPDAALPHLTQYVAGLPDGLDSHPQCLAKASLYRSVLEARPLPRERVPDLPTPIRALVERPQPVSAWIPEVHSHAVMSAAFDLTFSDDQEFATFAYERQRNLFRGPLYAVLLRLASPSMAVQGAARRWKAFHRGTAIEIHHVEAGSAELRLPHPHGTWDDLSRIGLAAGLRAVLDVSGAHEPAVEVTVATPTLSAFVAHWS